MICIDIDNGSNNTVGGSCYSSHQAVIKFAEHHIDTVAFIANARLDLLYLSALIRRLNVSLKLTVSFLIEFWYERRQKTTSINWVTI